MQDWKAFLTGLEPSAEFSDETAAIRTTQLALEAARLGTFAVGAILLDEKGVPLIEGYNQTFVDGFRSDLHAEMVVINQFETEFQGQQKPGELTILSSLEPCPMCMARLIYSGIGSIKYICEDPLGGMVTRLSSMPPKIQEMSRDLSQTWALADCSPGLREAAYLMFEESRAEIDQRVVERGGDFG